MSNEITSTDSACPVFIQEMSAEQIAADKAEAQVQADAKAAKAAAREALLARLGITAEEAQLLLGGQ
jgi:hypothetical protein